MTLQSLTLLPELQRLPFDETARGLDTAAVLERLSGMDRDIWSIEVATAAEVPLLGLFEARNIPDEVQEAYQLAFSNSDLNLNEHYSEMLDRGEASIVGFVSNLKGKLAELQVVDLLEERFSGYEFEVAADPTQPVWDLRGVSTEGAEDVFVQVKMGGESYAPEVLERMESAPNTYFAVSQEIYDRIIESSPGLAPQLIDTGISSLGFTDGVGENLELLKGNWGLDVPDEAIGILPYVTEVVLGIKLILDIISVERGFKDIVFQDRRRVHALKALVLMSRFGISTVCVTLGGAAGTLAVPGLGSVAGSITGGGLAIYLNRRLKPRMLEVAMKIAGVTEDDLFYFQNKTVIDGIGQSLASTSAS